MRIIHAGRGSCQTPLIVPEQLTIDPKGPENLREFAEFRPLIHAKPVEHDDKILSLYPINLRKND